ncbi:MAG: thioredoxin family protein [Chlamydiae bacterium]|nr:thioredoxin family protein [Chlamydiota bacterium]
MKIIVKELKSTELESLKKGTYIVQFHAPWCGFCTKFSPVFEEVATEMKGKKVMFAKINIDEEKAFSQLHGVSGVPTTKIFKDGKVIETITGFQKKEEVMVKIQNHIQG